MDQSEQRKREAQAIIAEHKRREAELKQLWLVEGNNNPLYTNYYYYLVYYMIKMEANYTTRFNTTGQWEYTNDEKRAKEWINRYMNAVLCLMKLSDYYYLHDYCRDFKHYKNHWFSKGLSFNYKRIMGNKATFRDIFAHFKSWEMVSQVCRNVDGANHIRREENHQQRMAEIYRVLRVDLKSLPIVDLPLNEDYMVEVAEAMIEPRFDRVAPFTYMPAIFAVLDNYSIDTAIYTLNAGHNFNRQPANNEENEPMQLEEPLPGEASVFYMSESYAYNNAPHMKKEEEKKKKSHWEEEEEKMEVSNPLDTAFDSDRYLPAFLKTKAEAPTKKPYPIVVKIDMPAPEFKRPRGRPSKQVIQPQSQPQPRVLANTPEAVALLLYAMQILESKGQL